ncbi:MAG: ATP synthase F1 subunit gamma [bacterium]|nr:ATP synthase F1 subunit gamma [bacterium]
MAENLIDLRRRIKSVKNTQKSTKAMKTVSAAKLRRSVTELNKTKPMMAKISSLLRRVGNAAGEQTHPLLENRDSGVNVMVVVTGDKGLCGAFNSHVIGRAENHYNQLLEWEGSADNISLVTVGNKGFRHFNKRGYPIKKNYPSVMARLTYQNALDLSTWLQDIYLNPGENIKKIEFVSTQYISASKQELSIRQLFPIKSDWEVDDQVEDGSEAEEIDYIYEPSAEAIFKALLPKYINSMVYQVLLQSAAAEHAARMIAMDLATKNASEMIRNLTLTMNKLRQASITKELLEIITATEALQQ